MTRGLPVDEVEGGLEIGMGKIVNFDETVFRMLRKPGKTEFSALNYLFPSENPGFRFCMLDFLLKIGFYPVFRFHKKSGSHPYLEGDLQEGVRTALLPLDEPLPERLEVQRVHVQVGGEVVQVVVGQGEVPLHHVGVLEGYLGGQLDSLSRVQVGGRELGSAIPETIDRCVPDSQ